tara:strand:+ start:1241 stop:1399 length:159 start_codon:yes stop_codon:yes gene_type:complete
LGESGDVCVALSFLEELEKNTKVETIEGALIVSLRRERRIGGGGNSVDLTAA